MTAFDFYDPFNIEQVGEYLDMISPTKLPPARRVTVRGHRFYYSVDLEDLDWDEIQFFKSTTTVGKFIPREMAKGLERWRGSLGNEEADRYMDDRALYGTLLHILFAEYLRRVQMHGRGAALLYQEEVVSAAKSYADGFGLGLGWVRANIIELQKDLIALHTFVNVYDFEPYLIEKTIFHGGQKYAGTIDIFGKMWFGERYGETAKKALQLKDPKSARRDWAQIDLKSGKSATLYPGQELQLVLNADAIEWQFPEIKVAGSFKLAPKDWQTRPGFHLVEADREYWASRKYHILELAEAELGGVADWPYMTALEPGIFVDDESNPGLSADSLNLKKRTVREAVTSYEVGTPDFALADSSRLAVESQTAQLVRNSHDKYFTNVI